MFCTFHFVDFSYDLLYINISKVYISAYSFHLLQNSDRLDLKKRDLWNFLVVFFFVFFLERERRSNLYVETDQTDNCTYYVFHFKNKWVTLHYLLFNKPWLCSIILYYVLCIPSDPAYIFMHPKFHRKK